MILPIPCRCTWCLKDTNTRPCEHCGKPEKELTETQLRRLDFVHNQIFGLMQDLVPGGRKTCELSWDMEIIGEVADVIEHYFVEQEVCTEMEFAPYLEET